RTMCAQFCRRSLRSPPEPLMFRYRCPHCSQLLQALEIRAGKTTVCSKCSRPLTIPADKAQWLNERGEALLAAPTVVVPGGPPEVGAEPDADVLGAIAVGAEDSREDKPLRLRSQADIAAELTTALTTRMKPPPRPPRDIRPSTAVWLLATGIAVALLILALLTSNAFLPAVACLPGAVGIGRGEVGIGCGWVAWIAGQRDWRRGLLAILPPANVWFLTRRRYAKYRPLWFVITGALLLAAAFASGYALPHTRAW